LTDTPPANVDIISFRITVAGATLNPGSVDLLAGAGPQDIEVKRLQVEKAFLSTTNVPASAGPFTSLTLAFANPELTFFNGTANPLAGCSPGAVCEIKPSGTLAATVNFNPALSLTANNSVGLLVDLHLNTILTNTLAIDFGAAGAVSVTQTQTGPENQMEEMEEVEDVSGQVANKGANTFDLKASQRTFTGIQVDKNTVFSGFSACTANPPDFTCVQNGQLVEVDLAILAGGALLAKRVQLEGPDANDEELEGLVTSLDAKAGTFAFVALDDSIKVSNSVLGSPMQVKIQPGAHFEVDPEHLSIGSALSGAFADVNSLLVGQAVQVRRVSGDGSTASPILTDRVRLKETRFTAPVKAKLDANTFTVDTSMLALLNQAGISEIKVDASQAKFTGVANVSALNGPPNPDTVSLRGLLFKQAAPAPPLLVASRVRKH